MFLAVTSSGDPPSLRFDPSFHGSPGAERVSLAVTSSGVVDGLSLRFDPSVSGRLGSEFLSDTIDSGMVPGVFLDPCVSGSPGGEFLSLSIDLTIVVSNVSD